MDLLLLLLLPLILICENAIKISSKKKDCTVADCEYKWRNFRTDIEYQAHTHSFNPSNATYLGNRVNMSGARLRNYVIIGPNKLPIENFLLKKIRLSEESLINDESEYITALDLSYTYVGSIAINVFAHFPCLTDLYLYGNVLTKLHEKLFIGLDNLKVLNLSNNRIASINNSNIFRPLNKLEILDLSKNNLIQLKLDMLLYLINLRQLFLNKNKINAVVKFSPIPVYDDSSESAVYHTSYQLRDLDLEYNRLVRFDTAAFFRFHLLKWINLIGNNICELIFNDGITFPHVIYLNITHNSLPGFDAESFRKTFGNKDVLLDFNDNPILCASRQVLLPALKKLDVHIREFEEISRPYMICKITYDENDNNTLLRFMNGTYNIPRTAQLQLFSTYITGRLNTWYSRETVIFWIAVSCIIFAVVVTIWVLSGRGFQKVYECFCGKEPDETPEDKARRLHNEMILLHNYWQ